MMKNFVWIPFFFLLCTPCFAEFYKYLDENGAVRFTDDLSLVPEDQREKAAGYSESKSTPSPSASPARPESAEKAPAPEETGEREQKRKALDKDFRRLETMRKELEKEYKALSAEKERLDRTGKVTGNKYKARQHSKALEEFVKKREQLEMKRKKYNEELKIYNEKLHASETG
ncbi:MAG: DUF4124 domain-containing protein [Desulfococcaceae bacterium]|jgi:hypothetical protein|nr:DUF4124 domain-containing protein [Desulfococcaceae bacterium]